MAPPLLLLEHWESRALRCLLPVCQTQALLDTTRQPINHPYCAAAAAQARPWAPICNALSIIFLGLPFLWKSHVGNGIRAGTTMGAICNALSIIFLGLLRDASEDVAYPGRGIGSGKRVGHDAAVEPASGPAAV